jgi:hypothetical protein
MGTADEIYSHRLMRFILTEMWAERAQGRFEEAIRRLVEIGLKAKK